MEMAKPLTMKLPIPNSGTNNAGDARKVMMKMRKNTAPRNAPIKEFPASDDVSPIGIAMTTGMKKRNMAESPMVAVITYE